VKFIKPGNSNSHTNRSGWRTHVGRALIGAVAAWNLQCAAAFLLHPAGYAAAFELSGAAGEAAIRGIGVLFVMWNFPYLVALWHPLRHRVSLCEALAMQAVGVLGETLILRGLPAGHAGLRAAIGRFILFDGVGMALLIAAWLITARAWRSEAGG